jgi:hypothetical protein
MTQTVHRHSQARRTRHRQRLITQAVLGTLVSTSALAFEIDTGVSGLNLRWDQTVRGNLGMRTEKQDSRILANPNYDESDGKFDKGDLVTQRLDLLTEFDLNYRNTVGLRVTGAAWYDHAYNDTSVRSRSTFATSYTNNEYNDTVKRYARGPSGEILDAFAWVNFDLFNKPANLKVGRHTNYWGEAYVLGAHAISYSQSPVDGVKAVNSPGIELKEVFLPLGQAYLKFQPTPELSLAAQYFYEWKPSRLPYGGTYFGPADFFFEGPDRLPVDAAGNSLAHAPSVKPKSAGNWGVSAKLNIESIESTMGLYFRRFDDYNPWFSPNFTGFVTIPGVGTVPTAWQLTYPKNVSLLGASLARVVGPVSVSGEVSYRRDGALNASAINPMDNEGPRGNTWHALVNGVYLLPKTAFSDTGSLVAELAYSRLGKVTSNAAYYKGEGTASCLDPLNRPGDKTDGCSTRDYLGMAVLFTPQYLQVMPSWDLDLPMSLNYGLRGNAASAGGGNEGSVSWSLGAKMTYAQKHEFQLVYADTHSRAKFDPSGTVMVGGNGGSSTNDRGWIAFTYKTGF